MSVFRIALACILSIVSFAAPTISARADAAADLQAFVRRASTLTFPDFVTLHGEKIETGKWKASVAFGSSLSRCLIVDLPSMDSVIGGGTSDQPYSSALQCDGARAHLPQAALVAWAIKIVSPLLPQFSMHRNPASKTNGHRSVVWKNASGLTIDFIAQSKNDYKGHNGARLGYVIEVEQLSPETMANPTP